MINIYEQVSRNKFQSGLILLFFSLFILAINYLIVLLFELPPQYLLAGLLITTFSSLGSFFYGDQIILSLNKAKPASRKEYFNYYTVTENLSLGAQIPTPKIYVIQDPSPNAFASGRDPDHAIICVTTGLLSQLNRSQLEAVIAHEISHIKNYDIRLMMIVSVLVGTLSSLIYSLRFFRSSDNNERRQSGIFAIFGLLLIILSPLIAKIIQLAISRRREYLADASAVKLTKQVQPLIEALTIISSSQIKNTTASHSSASLYISNPFKNIKAETLFSTHPPIEKRIEELSKMSF